MRRLHGILHFLLICCAITTSTRAGLPDDYSRLILARSANDAVEQAASDMAGLLQQAYGEKPQIRRHRLFEIAPAIHIGTQPQHPRFDNDPLTDEILVERTRRGILITGSDNTATCFAVYRFLEHFLGWRYYHPGPLGLERMDDAAEPPSLDGEYGTLLYQKAGFYSRNLSGIRLSDGAVNWSNWNGLRERFQFSHAIHRIITPDKFPDHPDWFAKDAQGNPMRPPFDQPHGYNDHPDLSSNAVRAEVVQEILKQLTEARDRGEKPLATSSLSLGDSFVFGHYPDDYPWKPTQYFRRWPDWSNHVFDFTNDVARQIADYDNGHDPANGSNPELYLGALSYLTWENVPDFDVHPSIVPYLTYDRSQWYDPQARQDDLANVAKWAGKQTKVLGTWDYLFGYGFLMPRSLSGVVAESIPALYRLGVRAYFSQVAPIWPYDAHTTWLAAQLLWNPSADAGQLLDTFFREYFGPAHQPMATFFELAEQTWMDQQGAHGWWLRYWKDPWQASLWNPETIERMQALLDHALRITDNVESRRFNQRIRLTADLFRATSLFIHYQDSMWRLQSGDSTAATQELELRNELIQSVDRATESGLLTSNAGDLSWIFRYDSIGGAIFSLAGNGSLLDPLSEWCRLQGFNGIPGDKQTRSVLFDNNFEHAGNPRVWHQFLMDSEQAILTSLPGGGGYLAANIRRGHVYQPFKAVPEHFYLGSLEVDTSQSPTGEIYIRIDFYDTDKQLISESRRVRIAPTGRYGNRQSLKVLTQAPDGAETGRLFIRFYEMDPDSQAVITDPEVLDLGPPRSP